MHHILDAFSISASLSLIGNPFLRPCADVFRINLLIKLDYSP